jgi:hypothetical protein
LWNRKEAVVVVNRIAVVAAAAMLAAVLAPAATGETTNMIGGQSQNVGIPVVPAPGKVTIDGDLKDWDLSGRVWAFADKSIRSRYSAEVAMMWDAANLYVAIHWKDPTPMFNLVDPAFNPSDGWKSDAVQLRFRTDRISHFTCWYYMPKKMPCIQMESGKSLTEAFHGTESFLAFKENGTDLGRGLEMAFRMDDDEKGYVQEIKLPWTVLYAAPPAMNAGAVFRVGMEFMWGDPTGKTWPTHRYADNMQPGETSREFYWTNWKAWGDAALLAAGHVRPREYIDAASRLQGTIPLRLAIPKKAARFTVAIDDAEGRRVRNLAGDFIPEDFTVNLQGDERTVEVFWDGLDDKGRLVGPGTYKVVGLTHEGLGAEYERSFYNPGTPPWSVKGGSGAWGADHAAPSGVAAAGDWMIVSWAFAEGGSGLLGVAPDGLKKWGEKRGALALAADERYVYATVSSWHAKGELCRFSKTDGTYQPFVLDGKPRPFELPVPVILGEQPESGAAGTEAAAAGAQAATQRETPARAGVVAMAAGKGRLVLALGSGELAVLDAASAKLMKRFPAPGLTAVALGPDGRCYAVLDGRLTAVDLESGRSAAIETPGLGKAGAIAVGPDGQVAVADVGPDSQVKVYTPDGKLAWAAGRKGGRPIRGPFDPEAMMHVSSVAVDSLGHIWVTESWDFPRRVSVWGRDGKLVRDYIGNTGYAGTGCYLHEQDPALAYVGPIEIGLTPGKLGWRVNQVLWVPGEGEGFRIDTGSATQPMRLASAASGKRREYLYAHDARDGGGHVIYMERGGAWQPVAAVCLVGHFSGRIDHAGVVRAEPSGEFAGLSAFDGCFWTDTNKDGKVQKSECTILPARVAGNPNDPRSRRMPGLLLNNGWGGRIGSDLVFYADGLVRYKPVRFTDDGAPVYAPEGMEALGLAENGDLVPVPEEHLLLCLSFKGYAGPTTGMLGVDSRDGRILWSYPNPYPGVHGSHRATMPKPGLLIGPLKVCGVAEVSDRVGRVFVLRGNLGQDFFMTTDGLYVGALFQDGRLPGDALPEKETPGMDMSGFSHGSEPFNGWFGKQADGVIRMTTGFPREAAMVLQVKGLETIRRFAGPAVTLDAAAVEKAKADVEARSAIAGTAKSYAIRRMAAPPKLDASDGGAAAWADVPPMTVQREGSPEKGVARLAYDAENLYVRFQVTDASPWLNEGKDFTRLFKTGDAVDIQLATDPASRPDRRDPAAGDLRVVLANFGGKPVAVLMKAVDRRAPAEKKVKYHSPVGDKSFDRVEIMAGATVVVKAAGGRYTVEAALPLKDLGLDAKPGLAIRGDVGFISSDAQGTINTARTYWANKETNLVSDLPQEAWLFPGTWGELKFE